jgi:hemerythrin-like domain-containing protein
MAETVAQTTEDARAHCGFARERRGMTCAVRQNMHADDIESSKLYTYMVESHRQLDTLYTRVLNAMETDAPNLCSLWTEFDHRLSAHMEAEERFVLPTFARVDRIEALALIREHGDIRALMLELGVAVDLHELRFEKARDLVELLRSHSGREDNLLYRWADQNLDVGLAKQAIAHARR